MTALAWDLFGERFYETGIDRGVLYIPDSEGNYVDGVAWNGLVSVTEKPSGAAPSPQYADNLKYLNLYSAEEFGAELDAFTYPDEFAQFDGLSTPSPGVTVGQQSRKGFGLCYRTKVGNDVDGTDLGHKLHLVYGCRATPSDKAYGTINASPNAIQFKWVISTQGVAVTGMAPTSVLTIDSSKVDATALADLERILYGDVGVDPALPHPDFVIALFDATIVVVTPIEPAFNSGTHTITIPVVAGVEYLIAGVVVAAGAHVIAADTVVTSRPTAGHVFTAGVDDDWFFDFV